MYFPKKLFVIFFQRYLKFVIKRKYRRVKRRFCGGRKIKPTKQAIPIGIQELKKTEAEKKLLEQIELGTSYQQIHYKIVRSAAFSTFIQLAVFLNISIMLLPFFDTTREWVKKRSGFLDLFECFFVSVYAVECALKLRVEQIDSSNLYSLSDCKSNTVGSLGDFSERECPRSGTVSS